MAIKPVWKEPPSVVRIRSSRSPRRHDSLSGVVLVEGEQSAGHANITFTDTTASRLAKYMPMGIGPAHPAYLKVSQAADQFEVWCSYLDGSAERLLWRQPSLPEWCSSILN